MNTLLLNRDNWDLCLDTAGNIALATDPYSQVQDVASSIRLFRGELWYDTAQGIPYFEQILGQAPPIEFMRDQFERRALTVPGVVSATAYLTFDAQARVIGGQVQFRTSNGVTQTALVA